MYNERRGMLYMLLCAALWSLGGVLIKGLSCNALFIAGARSLFSMITVMVFIAVTKQHVVWNRRVLLGAFVMSTALIGFVAANKLTTAANAIVLQYTQPVFILFLSAVFLKVRCFRSDVVAVSLTLVGIVLFFVEDLKPTHVFGNLIAVYSGFGLAVLYILLNGSTAGERISSVLFGHLFTAVVGLPFFFLTENLVDGAAVVRLVLLGVVQLGIPYILVALASAHCPPLACSLLGMIEPLLNPLWVAIFNGETPGVCSLIGGIIVLVTISGWCIYKNKKAYIRAN